MPPPTRLSWRVFLCPNFGPAGPPEFLQINHQRGQYLGHDPRLRRHAISPRHFHLPRNNHEFSAGSPMTQRPPSHRHRHAVLKAWLRVTGRREPQICPKQNAGPLSHFYGDALRDAINPLRMGSINPEMTHLLRKRVSRDPAQKIIRRPRHRPNSRLHLATSQTLRDGER